MPKMVSIVLVKAILIVCIDYIYYRGNGYIWSLTNFRFLCDLLRRSRILYGLRLVTAKGLGTFHSKCIFVILYPSLSLPHTSLAVIHYPITYSIHKVSQHAEYSEFILACTIINIKF